MVNTQYLDEKVVASGLKIGYITEQLGICRQAFDLKKKNKRKFKVAEIYVLCDLLKLNNEEKQAIFYAPEVNL